MDTEENNGKNLLMKEKLINTPEPSDQIEKFNVKASLANKTLNEDVKENYCIYFYFFCILGLVNNAGYVMIGTAAHDLAIQFGKKSFMPLFTFCEIVCGSMVKFVNSKYLINVKHSLRLTINSIIMLIAYLLIAAITIHPIPASFYLGLFCALLHGTTASLGESTILGLLKGFPGRLVGAFSSGTGFAGVFGAGIFLILQPFLNNGIIFLIATPIVLVYFMNVILVTRKKNLYPFVEEIPEVEARVASVRKSMDHPDQNTEILGDENEKIEGVDIGEDATDNISMNFANLRKIFGRIGWFLSNLTSVYFLEYTITVGLADAYSN